MLVFGGLGPGSIKVVMSNLEVHINLKRSFHHNSLYVKAYKDLSLCACLPDPNLWQTTGDSMPVSEDWIIKV